jgi:leucyl-tRNA synthetase
VARFFTKIGILENPEPFKQMLFNGKVTASDGTAFSKSKGNGIDPLEIINQGYGADALRTFLMFAAPLELGARWDPQGVPATHRFISRVWNLVQEYLTADAVSSDEASKKAVLKPVHQMIKKVTDDLEKSHYNTAIAAMMECTNELYKLRSDHFGNNEVWKEALGSLVACMAPFAPHASEELWHQLGHSLSVNHDSWPAYDEKYLVEDTISIAVQVNGKLRGDFQAAPDVSEADAIASAQALDKVKAHTDGHEIIKTIYVPGKIVNLVVR